MHPTGAHDARFSAAAVVVRVVGPMMGRRTTHAVIDTVVVTADYRRYVPYVLEGGVGIQQLQ